jgi:hypothetical protein
MQPITTDEITHWIEGTAPTAERVEELAQAYPCFMLPAATIMRLAPETLSEEQQQRLCSRLALAAPRLDAMTLAANADLHSEYASFYPPEENATPTTSQTIDTFLDTYGTDDPDQEALLTRLIFNPTPDYAQILARQEQQSVPEADDAPTGSPDDRINRFIIKSRAQGGQFPSATAPAEEAPQEPKPAPAPIQKTEVTDGSLLSESLAQIYIRRGNYTKAYEIISQLNLNFPKKSVYFAHQLRFLSKLIAIEKRRSEQTKQ